MFVKNSKDVGVDKFYCPEFVGKYFIYECFLPLFAIEDGKYVFIKTKNFIREYKNAPLWVKIACSFS